MSDPLQFEAFIRDYQNMVFTTAYRLLADENEAQDIAQEVFIRAYDRFDALRLSPTVGGWLKTVTRNLCLTHLTRHRARWKLFSDFRQDSDEPGDDPAERLPAPDTLMPALDAADRQAVLGRALDELPAGQRLPLVLFHFEDLSYEEIARELDISVAKVKVDIHRGRRALRQKLERVPESRMI